MTTEEIPPLSRAETRISRDVVVAQAASPLFLATAILLVAFTFATPFVHEFPASVMIAAGEAVLAAAFLAGHLILRSAGGVRYAHPIFTALAFGGVALVCITYLATGDALVTAGMVLLIVGAGIIMLSWRWLAVVLAVSTFTWLGVIAGSEDPRAWQEVAFIVVAAGMVSALAHHARMSTHLKLEALRRHEQDQRANLVAGLDALRVAEERLRSVVGAAPVILLATDADGYVTLAAGRGLAARGWSADDLVGRPAARFFAGHSEEIERLQQALRGSSSGGLSVHEGRTFETLWTSTFEPGGAVVGTICVATDVTERLRAEEVAREAAERESAIARLQEMDRFKTRILNTASHELNTPLTPIKLQMHLLKQHLDGMDARQQKAVNLLDRNVDRLASLVADIMDVARLQEGHLRIARTKVDLDRVVKEAVVSYEAVADANKLTLVAGAQTRVTVDADPKRLLQILFNLLGNAMKFTPAGGTVRVDVRPGIDLVHVDVHDTGPGLTDDQIALLFRPFSQVHDTARTSHGGTGLGLYVSRGIAEQHGGSLSVTSDGPGRGSTFTLTLPLKPTPKAGA